MLPFIYHGCEFTQRRSDQWCGTAPFSEKSGKFYVNPQTGQWDDKRSGKGGNQVTFLEEVFTSYQSNFTSGRRRAMEKLLELPPGSLRGREFGWDPVHNAFVLPQRGRSRRIHNHWLMDAKSREIRYTRGLKLRLGGEDALARAQRDARVWLCEGPKDAIALRWRLDSLGHTTDVVTYVPGAEQFKEPWAEQFRGREVILCYDHDAAGRRGTAKATRLLDGIAASLSFIDWPENYKDGWDIRDFIVYGLRNDIPAEDSWRKWTSLIKPVQVAVRRRFPIFSADDYISGPGLEWLISGMFPMRSFGLMFGQPGALKTFLAFEIAAQVVAAGGNVLFVGGEGLFAPRLRALRRKLKRMGVKAPLLGLHFMREVPNVANPRDIDEFVAAVQRSGVKFNLIIIDPLNSAVGGADENSTKDMTAVKLGVESLIQRLESAVLLIHHARKSDGEMRGSTVIHGAADVVVRVERVAPNRIRVSCKKARDFEAFEPRYFRTEEVMFRDNVSSVYLVPDESLATRSGISVGANALLDVLKQADTRGLNRAEWERRGKVKGGTFCRSVAVLEESGRVVKRREGRQMVYTVAEGRETRTSALGQGHSTTARAVVRARRHQPTKSGHQDRSKRAGEPA